jgi:hypothetical protein
VVCGWAVACCEALGCGAAWACTRLCPLWRSVAADKLRSSVTPKMRSAERRVRFASARFEADVGLPIIVYWNLKRLEEFVVMESVDIANLRFNQSCFDK